MGQIDAPFYNGFNRIVTFGNLQSQAVGELTETFVLLVISSQLHKNVLPSWRNGTETSPEFVTVPLLTAGVRVWASVVNTTPQVGKAGHVRAGHVGGAGGGEGGPGVVLPPPPQPHLLRVLQPRLGRGLVAQQGEGQVPAPVPTLRPRLLPRAHNTCLEVTRVLQWN